MEQASRAICRDVASRPYRRGGQLCPPGGVGWGNSKVRRREGSRGDSQAATRRALFRDGATPVSRRGGDCLTARATVRMPGTCGELVQGRIDGVPFHVSCPIDLFSQVDVELLDGAHDWGFPLDAPKAAKAVKAALAHIGLDGLGGCLSISSCLPRGKGMASSTADVAGAIHGVFAAAGRRATPDEVADLALSIEPTDGSVFPGIALFDHRTGLVRQVLGPSPSIEVIVLDFGGEVDTLEFNARDYEEDLSRLEPRFVEALELVTKGLSTGDATLIGRGATLSALANQAILPKPQLPRVVAYAERIGALGVNVGHSGTVIGLLVDPAHHDALHAEAELRREFVDLESTWRSRIVGGGAVAI